MIRTFVVDDEPAALGRYASYVEEYGLPFLVAARCACAREALEAAALRFPDLVITDIRMPGDDGLALLARLRDSGWDGVAVVISGHDDFSYAQKAIRVGILDFLLKPVFPEDMKALLDRLRARIGADPCAHPCLCEPGRDADHPGQGSPEQVQRALHFIDANFDRHFSIDEVARAAGISPAWLSASFKRHVGISVMEYSRNRKVEKACELLARKGLPLKEIADSLDFPDLPTFAKLFRKVMGTSPGAYRKALFFPGGRPGPEASKAPSPRSCE